MAAEQVMEKPGVCVTQSSGKAGSIRGPCQGFSWMGRVQRQPLRIKGLRCHIVHLDRLRAKEDTWNQ